MQGVGTENCQGKTLGFEVRWAWAGFWATLSLAQNYFYFAKQLIFENEDDCLDKTFSDNFQQNKIGFNKNNFYCQKHEMR